MTLDASMNAETNNRCPEDPRAVGKRALRYCKRTRAAKVNLGVQLGTVECVGNEVGKFDLGVRW